MSGVRSGWRLPAIAALVALSAGLPGALSVAQATPSRLPLAQAAPPRLPLARLALPRVLLALPRAVFAAPARSRGLSPRAQAGVYATYASLPLRFEVNQGQSDGRVRFLARGAGYTLFLTSAEAILALSPGTTPERSAGLWPVPRAGTRTGETPALLMAPRLRSASFAMRPQSQAPQLLHLGLAGANPHPHIIGLDRLPGASNYFLGNDPHKWRTSIPGYARVEYRDIYPGVNLVYYGHQGQLEYDLVVAPGAHPRAIRLAIGGTQRLRLDRRGNLVLGGAGAILQQRPLIYQQIGGVRRTIAGRYVLHGAHQATVALGAYDARRPLIIDPVLSYSTYLGGSSSDDGYGIAVDSAGNAYVTGDTVSTDFPTANAFQHQCHLDAFSGCTNAFVAKLSADGSKLLYSTYLGGSGEVYSYGIAVDGAGDAYVTGSTSSANFPTANAFQNQCRLNANSICGDAFVVKLSADGRTLVYGTYLGGSAYDSGSGIAVDSASDAYVTGQTSSTDFPTANAAQSQCRLDANGNCLGAAFVTKLSADGASLIYSTYLGGSGDDQGRGIAVDSSGNAYITGYTYSTDFPTANALQSQCHLSVAGNCADAFVTKLSANGTLVYSSYLGGSSKNGDTGVGIAVDGAGNAYVVGLTSSKDFPTTSRAFQRVYGGANNAFPNAFVAKLSVDGSTLIYSTYLGGSGGDFGNGIAVDHAGTAYIVGYTSSRDFPTAHALQSAYGGEGDAFVAKISDPQSSSPSLLAIILPAGSGIVLLAVIVLGLVSLRARRRVPAPVMAQPVGAAVGTAPSPAQPESAAWQAAPWRTGATPLAHELEQAEAPAVVSVPACPTCGSALVPGKPFCASCGARLPETRVCGACGSELLPGKPFCAACGAPVVDGNDRGGG